jgi:hypothetical protein
LQEIRNRQTARPRIVMWPLCGRLVNFTCATGASQTNVIRLVKFTHQNKVVMLMD